MGNLSYRGPSVKTPEELRKERVVNWDKHFLVQLSKLVNIEMDGTYFDYITDKTNLSRASYKEEYKGKPIEIDIYKHGDYDPWWHVRSKQHYDMKHRCQKVNSAANFVFNIVTMSKREIDEDIITENNRQDKEHIFTKEFGRPCIAEEHVVHVPVCLRQGIAGTNKVFVRDAKFVDENDKEACYELTLPVGITLTMEQIKSIVSIIETT